MARRGKSKKKKKSRKKDTQNAGQSGADDGTTQTSTLFQVQGVPMAFYMPVGRAKAETRRLIESHGGIMKRFHDPDCITLVGPGQAEKMANKYSGVSPVYLSKFVEDSVTHGTRQVLSSYRVNPKPFAAKQPSGRSRQPYEPVDDARIALFYQLLDPVGKGVGYSSLKVWEYGVACGYFPGRTPWSLRTRFTKVLHPKKSAWQRMISTLDKSHHTELHRAFRELPFFSFLANAKGSSKSSKSELADAATAPQQAKRHPDAVVDFPTPVTQLGVQLDVPGEGADQGAESMDSEDRVVLRMLRSIASGGPRKRKRGRGASGEDNEYDDDHDDDGRGAGQRRRKTKRSKRNKEPDSNEGSSSSASSDPESPRRASKSALENKVSQLVRAMEQRHGLPPSVTFEAIRKYGNDQQALRRHLALLVQEKVRAERAHKRSRSHSRRSTSRRRGSRRHSSSRKSHKHSGSRKRGRRHSDSRRRRRGSSASGSCSYSPSYGAHPSSSGAGPSEYSE